MDCGSYGYLKGVPRNEAAFHVTTPNSMGGTIQTMSYWNEFIQTQDKPNASTENPNPTRVSGKCGWRPPRTPTIKTNVDAVFNSTSGRGAYGIVCRDWQGNLLNPVVKKIVSSSPLTAEALGLREAMVLASNLSMPHVLFESDNQTLIET